MALTRPKRAAPEHLRASPSFALTFTLDGRPYIAKDTEPYIQYWLSERDRILLSMFSRRGGATIEDAIAGYQRLTRTPRNAAEHKRALKVIDNMREANVLITTRDDTSRYSAKIVDAYVAHRPFPREISDLIIRSTPVSAATEILDLAGGPGDLSLALARASQHVSMMELSRGFLNAVRTRAKQMGLQVTPMHDSCNRLVYRDETYDVVTISQALHWMDDVMVCRGLCRCLRPGGSFYVIQGGFEVDDAHPLSYLLGNRSILGHRPKQSFAKQAQALQRRLTLLFDALDAPDVHRVDIAQPYAAGDAPTARIVPAGATLFRQTRPMDAHFARAFLTPQHIAVTGMKPDAFWKDLEARCAGATTAQLLGTYDWSLLHFRRGGAAAKLHSLEASNTIAIGYEVPVTASRR